MGDGSVALTIDVLGISTAVRPNLEVGPIKNMGLDTIQEKRKNHQMDISEFLLIDVGAPGSYAIPLTVVSRLEEFNEDEFELSGEQKVIKYGESLLPIFSLPEFLQLPFSKNPSQDKKIPVVVIRRGDNLYGIEVFQIQDVAAMPARIDQTVRDRPGILGTMVANDAVLVVVDIFGMIDAVKSKLAAEAGYSADSRATFEEQNEKDHQFKRRKHRILLVEDSSFFRSYIRQIIEESGYQVLTACDGLEGWNILEGQSSQHFSLVISDIEMPCMDGLQLAKKISEDKKYKNLLLIAVTTRFSSADRQRGLEAGFTRYLEKLNAEKLIAEMDELLLASSRKPELGKELKLANSH
jgi:two-component system chemotaxis sensor kinase CheA